MPNADEKPDDKSAPIPFTVDVTVDRTRVQVTLLLKPGTAVTVEQTKVEKPEPRPTAVNIAGVKDEPSQGIASERGEA